MIKDFVTTLKQKDQLTEDVWRFTFALKEGEELVFEAGQYMMLKVENNFRQYSIASSVSQKNSFEIVMEMIEGGVGSNYLNGLSVGDEVGFKGPAGVFVLRNTPKDKIFLATGTGIAPVLSMARTHLEEKRQGNVYLFFGLRKLSDIYLIDELEELRKAYDNFNYKVCLSREKPEGMDSYSECFAHGRVNISMDQLWESHDGHPNDFEYYICGSKKAVDSLNEYLLEHGVEKPYIFFERFTL